MTQVNPPLSQAEMLWLNALLDRLRPQYEHKDSEV